MRLFLVYISGLVFGVGIVISGMANPAKVINFFDVAGTWDPSLAFVMGGALVVAALGYRVVLKRPHPVFDGTFHLPTKRDIDMRLVGGSAVFGIGWGIAGFCPGGALPVVSTGNPDVLLFMGALIVGILTAKTLQRHSASRQTAAFSD